MLPTRTCKLFFFFSSPRSRIIPPRRVYKTASRRLVTLSSRCAPRQNRLSPARLFVVRGPVNKDATGDVFIPGR